MEESNIKITIKFDKQSIPVTISRDSTVQRLKMFVIPLTYVFPPYLKLIFKGRILEDDKSLRESGINDGAKIMLVGTKDSHIWNAPIKEEIFNPIRSRTNVGDDKEFKVDENFIELWKDINVVALPDCNLKEIPDEVWSCAPYIRLLDISHNFIQHIPDRIECLIGLRRLFLDGNDLSDESINWQGLTSLKFLHVLSLRQNCLNTLPSTLGLLASLRQLFVANNKLIALPIEIGDLTELEILRASNNRISSIPSNIGNCTSLIVVDFSSNHLSELPDEFCSLHNLKALHLSNNAIKGLPNSLFRMCTQLSTLGLHNTEITMVTLKQFEGWEDFDQRRRAMPQKLMDFEVISSAESDEDADEY